MMVQGLEKWRFPQIRVQVILCFGTSAWKVLVDDVNRRVVCLNGDEIVVVPADELNVPRGLAIEGHLDWPTRRRRGWNFDGRSTGFLTTRPLSTLICPPGLCKVRLNLSLQTNVRTSWYSSAAGRVKRENKTVTVSYEVNVEWPTLALPFSPVGVAVEEYSARVAVWQRSRDC